MIKFCFLTFIVFFISCKSIPSHNGITAEIINRYIKEDDTIFVILRNNTKINYFLPIDYKYKGHPPIFISPKESKNFYPEFYIYDSKKIPLNKICEMYTSHREINKDVFFFSDKDYTLLPSNSKIIIKFKFNKKNYYNDKFSCEYIYNDSILKIGFNYEVDKEVVKSFLNVEEIKDTTNTNYKCYNGTIKSNVIRLIVN
jgi:hypothetical protein